MEEQEAIIEDPVTVAGITIIPIAKVSLHRWHGNRRLSVWGDKQPVGVVVVSPSARRAFRMTGDEISPDELIRTVPGIQVVLKGV